MRAPVCLTLSLCTTLLCFCVKKWQQFSEERALLRSVSSPFSHCLSGCCLTKLFNFTVGRRGSGIQLLLSKSVKVTPETCTLCQISLANRVLSIFCDCACADSAWGSWRVEKQGAASPSVRSSQADGLVNAVMELCKTCDCSHACLSERRRAGTLRWK